MTGDLGNVRAGLRALSWAILATALGALLVAVVPQPTGASTSSASSHNEVQQWLESEGDRIVKEVLLGDPDWTAQLGLTSESHVTFGTAHRYLVIGVADYDLRTGTVQGDLSVEPNVRTATDYCAPVELDDEVVDLSLCVSTSGDQIEMTRLGQAGFITDVSVFEAEVDFIEDGPYGIYAYQDGDVIPLDRTAELNVPERTPADVFMEARAKRAAEQVAISAAEQSALDSGDGLILGAGPSLLNPDSEELKEWNLMVSAALEERAPDTVPAEEESPGPLWLTLLKIGGMLVMAVFVLWFTRTAYRAYFGDENLGVS